MTKSNKTTRREFVTRTAAAALGGVAGVTNAAPTGHGEGDPCHGGATGARGSRRCGRPNVLLIMVDEMRYPTVYEAPGLAQFRNDYLLTQRYLRESGVEFHRHYAASTACAPSRASIFTGHYPSFHGVTQTTGAAKEANDPDVFWLDANTVPTMGDYFRAAGYRSLYRGKWHVSNADLQIPGTHEQIVSYDDIGNRDSGLELLYQSTNRLKGFGFDGWIGPEPHGKAPLNTASSPPAGQKGRDQGFASQTVELLGQLDASVDSTPWFLVSSFVNPHDIALWGFFARNTGFFNFDIDPAVPGFADLFHPRQFALSLADDLATKPGCQESYRSSYHEWMQGVPPEDYFRLYYQLHWNVDREMARVVNALQTTRFNDNTIVVFTSDHGDLLGAHRYMHQKWYQAYDESLRVPLMISAPGILPEGRSVDSITSHVDLVPTLLGLAGLETADLLDGVSNGHSDPVLPVGRNLAPLVKGEVDALEDPIFFMTDDDPSRGLDQENVYGIAYDSVVQPNHIETVIVERDGEVWKYSRYFDNIQFWSDPAPLIAPPKDSVVNVEDGLISVPGTHPIDATERVKFVPAPAEFEMYNVTADPLELNNLAHNPLYIDTRRRLAALLNQERSAKRLTPVSGEVPGQP